MLAVVCKGSHSALGTWHQHVGATHRERAVKITPPASQAVVSKTSDSFFESHHSIIYKPYDFLKVYNLVIFSIFSGGVINTIWF